MKKHHPILYLFPMLFFISAGEARAQNHATTIKIQAMDMSRALIKNDFDVFIKYIPDKIIDYAGGKETMRSKMDSASVAMKNFGVSFKQILIGNPGKIIHYRDQLQSVLPQTTTLKTILGEMTAETSLIAVSGDNGKTWKFVDTNIYQVDKMKSVLPDLSPELVIPPFKKPEFKPASGN